MAEADLLPWVEEREVEWDTWSEHGLSNTKEETTDHETSPVEDRSLDSGNETPEQDGTSAEDVWWEDFPAC